MKMLTTTTTTTTLALCLLGLVGNVQGGGTTSRFQVQLPTSLTKEDGYDHREALFGNPPYGGSITQQVYYADASMCDTKEDYTRGGYPTRGVDSTGQMAAWQQPFILMVDRGGCTFVQKVRAAQAAGAVAVLIADDVCLCNALATCVQDEDTEDECETKEPIMADDGSGADISIPSFLLFKQEADPIKETLMQNVAVRAKMSWEMPAPDARVEYELWTTPKDAISEPFKNNFREVAKALGDHAKFTPHYYVYDGSMSGCVGEDGTSQCYNLCTNVGRYCSSDPDENFDKGLSGADMVTESLRQICIWNKYGSDGIGVEWWDYVQEFGYRCSSESLFTNTDCIEDAMARAGVDVEKINKCMDESGGLEAGDSNDVLDDELSAREFAGVVILPSLYVNQAPLRGAMSTKEVFEAICAGFVTGSEPSICKACSKCGDVGECVVRGHCPGSISTGVSFPVFAGSMFAVIAMFSVGGVIQWQRSQRQMRAQVRGIMAEYMPVDPNQKVGTVGFPDDPEEETVELS